MTNQALTYLFGTIIALTPTILWAQPLDVEPSEDSAYWTKQSPDVLKVKFGILTPSLNFTLTSSDSKEKAEFSPSNASKSSLIFSYRNIGLSISNQNALDKNLENKYGKSNATDFQIRLFGKRTYELTYQYYQGFHLKNSSSIDPSNSESILKRPDITSINIGATVFWDLDDSEFIQLIAFDQGGYQLKKAWGRSLLAHIGQNKIKGGKTLLPSTAHSNFPGMAYLKEVERKQVLVGGAIGGIYPLSSWYISSLFSLGVGYCYSDIENTSIKNESSSALGTIATLKLSMGRNGKVHGFGFNVFLEGVTSPYKYGEINSSRSELMLFYSYNFEDVNLPLSNKISSWLD